MRQAVISFDPPSNGTRTSDQAAKRAKSFAAQQREKVFAHIEACGFDGATDQEIQTALQLSGDSVRPRRGELVKASRIVDSGRTRSTASKNAAIVWWTVKGNDQ